MTTKLTKKRRAEIVKEVLYDIAIHADEFGGFRSTDKIGSEQVFFARLWRSAAKAVRKAGT